MFPPAVFIQRFIFIYDFPQYFLKNMKKISIFLKSPETSTFYETLICINIIITVVPLF